MSNVFIETVLRFSRLSPAKRAAIVFVITALLFTYGWSVFSTRPTDEVILRGVAFGLAFTVGYYFSAARP